jgi:hypothetical protein
MNMISVVVSIAATVAIYVTMVMGLTYGSSLAFAQGNPSFIINLNGTQEVPPVQTEATGLAEVTPGLDSIAYSINATNIEGVTAGHVHLGAPGENGPIVVTLFKYDTPMNEVSENGTVTADNLEGPMAGKQISDLLSAGDNNTLYLNIHTEQNPNGEIRGY